MLAKSPEVTLYTGVLQPLCYLRDRSDCYRLERPSCRAGIAPADDQRLITAHVTGKRSKCYSEVPTQPETRGSGRGRRARPSPRSAERRYLGPSYHEPPRRTRTVPEPTGSVVGSTCASRRIVATVHTNPGTIQQTLPCISCSPQAFARETPHRTVCLRSIDTFAAVAVGVIAIVIRLVRRDRRAEVKWRGRSGPAGVSHSASVGQANLSPHRCESLRQNS